MGLKKRTHGSAAQIGNLYEDKPRVQHASARAHASGQALAPRSRSVNSMKSPGYAITFKGSDGSRKWLKENTSEPGKWHIIIFSTKSQAQKQINGMSPDTIKELQPKITDLRHGSISKADQDLRDAQLKHYIHPSLNAPKNSDEAAERWENHSRDVAAKELKEGKITKKEYALKLKAITLSNQHRTGQITEAQFNTKKQGIMKQMKKEAAQKKTT